MEVEEIKHKEMEVEVTPIKESQKAKEMHEKMECDTVHKGLPHLSSRFGMFDSEEIGPWGNFNLFP